MAKIAQITRKRLEQKKLNQTRWVCFWRWSLMGLSKFGAHCLIITGVGGSEMIVTGRRRRKDGMVLTRGGMRIPANCMVAIRKFIAALAVAVRVVIPGA